MTEKIRFERHMQESTFHNPMTGGSLDTQTLEIRRDPLTGHQSVFNPRLEDKVAFFFGPSDYELIERLAQESETRCFLCEDRWEQMTPTYPEDLLPGGRIIKGEAVLFPNLFPVSQLHAVIRVGRKHYLPLKDFASVRLEEAFQTARELVEAVSRAQMGADYLAVSGNYLGPAGASIAHPHFQVVGSDLPFSFQELLLKRSRQYYREKGSCYWLDLLDKERDTAERYVGDTGPVSWLTSFSPQGTNEVIGILAGRKNFLEVEDQDLKGLADGFSRVLQGYDSMGISTFNFTIYSGPLGLEQDGFRCLMRIISRQNVYENYRTDDYFLQKQLRNELILTTPELLASTLKGLF